MWKWIVGIVLTVTAIVSVAREQHSAREKYETQREKDCVALAISVEEKHSCEKEAESRKDYTPWWYILVAWPEGITTWAIIGTGFVVAWQSYETRRAATATRDATILQHRPKVVIRSLVLTRDKSNNFQIALTVRNSGSTVAHVSEAKFTINWIATTTVVDSHQETITAIDLKPGEARTRKFTAPEFYIRFEACRALLESNPTQVQTFFLGCICSFKYTDEIGTRRDTHLNRAYDFRKEQFIVWDFEADYCD